MRLQGKIINWNDEKGFGFVMPIGGKELFLHISSLHNSRRRPKVSQLVTYEIVQDKSGRHKAINVEYVLGSKSNQIDAIQENFSAFFIAFFALFFVFVMERTFHGALPMGFTLIFIGANLLAFLYYYADKTAAIKGSWRTPEDILHILSLVGGWGGAYIAQKLFRHKNKKASFLFTY